MFKRCYNQLKFCGGGRVAKCAGLESRLRPAAPRTCPVFDRAVGRKVLKPIDVAIGIESRFPKGSASSNLVLRVAANPRLQGVCAVFRFAQYCGNTETRPKGFPKGFRSLGNSIAFEGSTAAGCICPVFPREFRCGSINGTVILWENQKYFQEYF